VTALVDQDKAITVISKDEAATVLALEMEVKKYGPRITAQGGKQRCNEIARIAARHNVWIEFTEATMRHAMSTERARLRASGPEQAWTQATGGIDALSESVRVTAQRDYANWAKANPKAAERITFADFVIFGQSPEQSPCAGRLSGGLG
jgi:hypothetical protein